MPNKISKADLLLAYKKVIANKIIAVDDFGELRKELVTGLEGSQQMVVDLMLDEANTVDKAYTGTIANYKAAKILYQMIAGLNAAGITYIDALKVEDNAPQRTEAEANLRRLCVDFAKTILLTEFLVVWGSREAVKNV